MSAPAAPAASPEPSAAPASEPPAAPVVVLAEVAWSRDEADANLLWSCFVLVALAGTFVLLRTIPSVGWPLLLAGFGAYLFDPVVTALERRGVPRGVTAGAFVALLVATAAAAVVLAVPRAVRQLANLPTYVQDLIAWGVPRIETALGRELPDNVEQLLEYGRTHAEQIASPAATLAGRVLGGSLSLVSALLGALVVPVVGFYLLRGWPRILAVGDGLVPERQRPFVRARMALVDRMLSGFVRGQLTMAVVLSVLYSVVMSVIGLQLGLVVGLATGFGNLVPYVGTSTGMLLAAAFCVVDFGVDFHLWLVLGTFVALVALDSIFITPNIVGDRVGLSPASVIVAVLACGSLFGFAGVLLAVPSAALLKQVAMSLAGVYRHSRWFQGRG